MRHTAMREAIREQESVAVVIIFEEAGEEVGSTDPSSFMLLQRIERSYRLIQAQFCEAAKAEESTYRKAPGGSSIL